MFVAVRNSQVEALEPGHHELRCYEVGKDGRAVDHVVMVNLASAENYTATSIHLGSNALYLNMNDQLVYKIDTIIQELNDNDMGDGGVAEYDIGDFGYFELTKEGMFDNQ